MNIRKLIQKAHDNAKKRGWWAGDNHNVPEKLALIHSEISEALEAYRDGLIPLDGIEFSDNDKPEGFAVELADTVIRIADLCGHLGIDLQAAITTKMKYNRQRSYRHGGKRC